MPCPSPPPAATLMICKYNIMYICVYYIYHMVFIHNYRHYSRCVNCVTVPVENSGGHLGSSSSVTIGVGLKFIGALFSSILFVLIVLVVWKLVEVLVERLRTGSADGPPSGGGHIDLRRRNPDEEEVRAAGCMTRLVERLKTMADRSKRRPLRLLLLTPASGLDQGGQ